MIEGQDRLDYIKCNMSLSDQPINMDFWQRDYLLQDQKFLIANKSRRIGWSFITALKGVLKANDPAEKKYVKQFVSYSLDDAKEKILYAKELFYSLPVRYRKKVVSETKTQFDLLDTDGKTVSRLISLPCKPPRGRGGDISLDEFAFHRDDHSIYIAALPVISRGGTIEIGSTPMGNKGKFFEILTDRTRYPRYNRYELFWYFSPALCTNVRGAIQEAAALPAEQMVEKYGTEILKDIFQSMPIDDFLQEYCCTFRDELTAFIPLELILACTPVGEAEIPAFKTLDELLLGYNPKIHGDLYAGYDVGRTKNASELLVMGYDPASQIRTVWLSESYRKVDFETQENILLKFLTLPVHRLAIDATGLGMHLGENLVKKRTKGRAYYFL